MDLVDRLLDHDADTTRELLIIARSLSAEELDRDFDLALRSVRATLDHIVRNVEVWTDLVNGSPIRALVGAPGSIDERLARQSVAAEDFRRLVHDVRSRAAWDAPWIDPLDDPPREKTRGCPHDQRHRVA